MGCSPSTTHQFNRSRIGWVPALRRTHPTNCTPFTMKKKPSVNKKKARPLHQKVRDALGCPDSMSDSAALAEWKRRTRSICKPCWELKYCPYGPLVEDFPLPPVTRSDSAQHAEHLRECLATGKLSNGEKLDSARRSLFKRMLRVQKPEDQPETLPNIFEQISCRVFGHICPVFFVAEPLTETIERRTVSRLIPRDVMLKVVRRDGQICQECNEPVRDDEVEFDHIIPFSKGGTSTPENLRLVHVACNRKKSDSLQQILAPNPFVHLAALQKETRKKR